MVKAILKEKHLNQVMFNNYLGRRPRYRAITSNGAGDSWKTGEGQRVTQASGYIAGLRRM